MSNKLFAFNVSKKTEKVAEKSTQQWKGQTVAVAAYCSGGQGYGNANCQTYWVGNYYQGCKTSGGSGYYICDN
ncbi:MAG TPA: hypothetical protein VGD98_23550 [Ktedonobacteraceae bacterium]